jgi:hypothetical protein
MKSINKGVKLAFRSQPYGQSMRSVVMHLLTILTLSPWLVSCEAMLNFGGEPPETPADTAHLGVSDPPFGSSRPSPSPNPGSPTVSNPGIPPAAFPGTAPPSSEPPRPKPLCTYTVNCPPNRVDINFKCGDEAPRSINGPLVTPSCEKIKAALSGKGLPTGKTQTTLAGGPNCEVACTGNSEGELRTQIVSGGSSSTVELGFRMPDVACVDMRDIINSLNLQ